MELKYAPDPKERMALDSRKKIVQAIAAKTRLSESEIESLVESKKGKFSGMLTDAGAAFMVAKELDVDLGLEKQWNATTPIAQLKGGMNQVDVRASVLQVFPPKEFEKNGRVGIVQNAVVGDETGSIRFTLWEQDVRAWKEQGIGKGATLLLRNASVSAFKEQLQLQLSYNGSVLVESNPPQPSTPLNEIKEGMKSVDTFARIQAIFPAQPFDRNGKQGLRARMLLGDGTKSVPAVAWNESAERVQRIPVGTLVKIDNAYSKKGLNGEIELHVGSNAIITPNPKNAPAISTS